MSALAVTGVLTPLYRKHGLRIFCAGLPQHRCPPPPMPAPVNKFAQELRVFAVAGLSIWVLLVCVACIFVISWCITKPRAGLAAFCFGAACCGNPPPPSSILFSP